MQAVAASAVATLSLPQTANAVSYQRSMSNKNIAYQIQLPEGFSETAKPVKTHLDEVNLVSEEIKGYQYGITVDPVRIDSIKQVGLSGMCFLMHSDAR